MPKAKRENPRVRRGAPGDDHRAGSQPVRGGATEQEEALLAQVAHAQHQADERVRHSEFLPQICRENGTRI
ncbi:hypothetical protein GCM10020221_12780 [Streptomyces thioluteus]|uniref:Uncharacterized protein n=1 Tax=Streptomyces thioluteus TaxID=66431 RepID=A0ABN3WL84_STRTU